MVLRKLEIRLRGGDTLIFGCFYRSPTPTINSEGNNEKLNSLLRSVSRKKYSHTSILGDFNYRDINWETCATPHNEGSTEAKFLETIQDCFLHQHIREPTRKRGNDEASLLDLILTDEFMQVSIIVSSPLSSIVTLTILNQKSGTRMIRPVFKLCEAT